MSDQPKIYEYDQWYFFSKEEANKFRERKLKHDAERGGQRDWGPPREVWEFQIYSDAEKAFDTLLERSREVDRMAALNKLSTYDKKLLGLE